MLQPRSQGLSSHCPLGVKMRDPGNEVANVTAPFNNSRTLKFKAQPIKSFIDTVNQMLGGSSQHPTSAVHCFVL